MYFLQDYASNYLICLTPLVGHVQTLKTVSMQAMNYDGKQAWTTICLSMKTFGHVAPGARLASLSTRVDTWQCVMLMNY